MASPAETWGDPKRRVLNQEIAKLIDLRRKGNLSYSKRQEVEKRIEELYAMMPPMPADSWLSRLWGRIFG